MAFPSADGSTLYYSDPDCPLLLCNRSDGSSNTCWNIVWKWSHACQRRLFFRLYLRRRIDGALFRSSSCMFTLVIIFCRSPQRSGTCFQVYDAGSCRTVRDHLPFILYVRPGALAGVKYFLVPNPANFFVDDCCYSQGQMFYSLSIAMGILITFGSYGKENFHRGSTKNVEIF